MTEELDGHVQNDPVFREMADIYSTIGGELPAMIFSNISHGRNMNELADRLIEVGERSWHTEENMDMFMAQAQDIIEEFEEKKLVQSEEKGWNLTRYGQQWRAQMDAANQTLTNLMHDDVIAASRFEAGDGQIVYDGDETLGNFYSALGFNVGSDADVYPEALPVLHILGEDVNDSEVPADYSEAVEQLELMGMVQDTDYDSEGSMSPELTEIGSRIYEEVVLDDREFVKEHYGLN